MRADFFGEYIMVRSFFTTIAAALSAAALVTVAACGVSQSPQSTSVSTTPTPPVVAAAPTKIGHVWVVMLENESYANSFGATTAPYLAKTLPAMGALLKNYYGTGHVSLDNYISLISGQGANAVTQSDCQFYVNFQGSGPQSALNGQAVGQGCVFPASVPNIADQLRAAGISWKGYMEDMGNDASRGVTATCGHPTLNSQDKTQTASATDNYATRHNPFMYFHSIIDDQPYCDAHVVNLKSLDADLADVSKTPAFNFITPGLCHDGHDAPCQSGEPGGLVSINTFLEELVPKIMASPAFQQDGLLLVTFDESNGPQADSSACCGNTSVNTATPGLAAASDGTSGGGLIGAVAIAPWFIKPGTVSSTDYSHYSMLRTWQDIFGLQYLGYAAQSTQASFGKDVFSLQMPVFPTKK